MSASRLAASLVLIMVISAPAAPEVGSVAQALTFAAVEGDKRFGINFVNGARVVRSARSSTSVRYRQAAEAGAKWTRWPMYWAAVEPNQGNRDYGPEESVINQDAASGLETHIILMGTPAWAAGTATAVTVPLGSDAPQPDTRRPNPPVSPPKNLYLAWNDPENYWGQFVYATVLRFKDRVRVWEIWNEPDHVDTLGRPTFWRGTVAEYYQLLKVGYQAAKAADPHATILFGGLSYGARPSFFPDVLDHALATDPEARDAGFFFDVLALHSYVAPYNILDWTQRLRAQMEARGFRKPIWVNEANVPVCGEMATSCGPDEIWRATIDEQASYIIQAFAYAVAADVERLSVFQLWDDGLAPREFYGLVSNRGTTRPAYKAYQVAAAYLTHPTGVTRAPGDGFEMIVLHGTPGGRVTVVWSTKDEDVVASIPAGSTYAQLVDQYGKVDWIVPTGASYTLTLPRATNDRNPNRHYLIGGRPYVLVEPIFPPPASRVSQLPEMVSDRSFVVSWERLDNANTPAVFDVQYRVGEEDEWRDWLVDLGSTSATFGPFSPTKVKDNETYSFRSRMTLFNGAVEPYQEGEGDAQTRVSLRLDEARNRSLLTLLDGVSVGETTNKSTYAASW